MQKCFSYFSENVVFDELIEFILELIYTEPWLVRNDSLLVMEALEASFYRYVYHLTNNYSWGPYFVISETENHTKLVPLAK